MTGVNREQAGKHGNAKTTDVTLTYLRESIENLLKNESTFDKHGARMETFSWLNWQKNLQHNHFQDIWLGYTIVINLASFPKQSRAPQATQSLYILEYLKITDFSQNLVLVVCKNYASLAQIMWAVLLKGRQLDKWSYQIGK